MSHIGRPKPILYKITKNGCYEISNRGKSRYISFVRFNKVYEVHRLIYYIFNGSFPEIVMHSCDNPHCINPYHLIGGTSKENSHDAIKKGRNAFGIRNKGGGNKLNDFKVKKIKNRLNKGDSLMTLAKKFKVSKKMILYIKQEKKWKHVKI